MAISSAVRTTTSNSTPGMIPGCPPSFFWEAAGSRLTMRGGQLFLAHHPLQLPIRPMSALRKYCVSFFIQFETDCIGPFLFDHPRDLIRRLLRDIGYPGEKDGCAVSIDEGGIFGVAMGEGKQLPSCRAFTEKLPEKKMWRQCTLLYR
jgi:hypothetical protein